MERASCKPASRNKQVATGVYSKKSGNVGATGRCLLAVNQTDVNSISQHKQNMDDDELDLFAIAAVRAAAMREKSDGKL